MTPLRQRMLEDMSIRNFAENTQLSYVQQVACFARYFGCSPEQLGPEQVREYQRHLIDDRRLTASSVGTATAALRFLYRVSLKRDWTSDDIPMPKKPFKLPVVLSPEEVTRFLSSIVNLKHRTILTVLYAAGLRVSEATHLVVTDVDSQRLVLRIDQGKGRKDRYVMLSPRLLDTRARTGVSCGPSYGCFPATSPDNHHTRRGGTCMPQGPPCQRHPQADHAALAATCVRHTPAGVWDRCAHDPAAARASQPGHDLALPEGCDVNRVRYHQPPGPAAQDRASPKHTGPFLRARGAPARAGGGGHLPPGRPCLSS